MCNRFIKALVLLVSIPVSAASAPVSRQQAQEVALRFMSEKGMLSTSVELAYRAPRLGQDASLSSYYVFNAPEGRGYVVVSGDDRTAEVLGYARKGTFDATRLPAHVKSFLQTYADEIRFLDDHHIAASQRAPRRAAGEEDYEAIAPLMASRWDQGSPYNLLCPSGSPTGCAATSTAQVMYYHKWPAATTAEIPSYVTETRHFKQDAVPAGTPFHWDDMADTYGGGASSASRQAVAELMSYVGRAIKMDYDFMGSGAFSFDMPPALNDYFDYQVTHLFRKNYSLAAFEDSIYNQLSNGYPVIFNGMSTGGGHSFVVDGYDSDHFFHVNWGWGGQDDNYFLLSVLNPYNNTSYGSSSSSDGFSFDQDVLFLKPGMQTKAPFYALMTNIVGVTSDGVLVEYYSDLQGTHTFQVGLGELTAEGGIVPLENTLRSDRLDYLYGEEGMEFKVEGLEAGTHRLVPICRQEGDSAWIYTAHPYADVDVDADGSLTFNTVWNRMQACNYDFEGSLFVNQQQPFKVTFRNDTDQDYYGPIYFFSNRGEGKTAIRYASYEGYSVPAHDSLRVSFTFTPRSSGSWTVSFASDPAGKCVLASKTVSINSGDLTIDGLRFKLMPSTGEARLVRGVDDYAGHIVIPDSVFSNSRAFPVTSLEANVFYGCADLLSVALPAPLTAIGDHAFEDCSSLESITIPANVRSIGPGVFAGCGRLTDIRVDALNAKYTASDGMLFSSEGKTLNTYPSAQGVISNLPDSLTVIGDGSLAGTAITRLVLPASVKTLGSACFSGCTDLKVIVSKAVKAPSCMSGLSSGTFGGFPVDDVQLIVPVGAEAGYAKAYGWSSFQQLRLFKDFGASQSLQTFSSSMIVSLDDVVTADAGDFGLSDQAAAISAYKVVGDAASGLHAVAVQHVVPEGNGLLVGGQGMLVFPVVSPVSSAYATADLEGNLLVAALDATDLSAVSGAYTFSGDAFVANSTDVLEAGSAYLLLDGATAPSLPLSFDQQPGGISTVSPDDAPAVIYDLQGRRTDAPRTGLYIVNGRTAFCR